MLGNWHFAQFVFCTLMSFFVGLSMQIFSKSNRSRFGGNPIIVQSQRAPNVGLKMKEGRKNVLRQTADNLENFYPSRKKEPPVMKKNGEGKFWAKNKDQKMKLRLSPLLLMDLLTGKNSLIHPHPFNNVSDFFLFIVEERGNFFLPTGEKYHVDFLENPEVH